MPQMHSRVLIVDDEYYLGQMLAQALINENIETIAVTEVDSAIHWIQKKSFDLVVSDIFLPGKTGIDLFNYVQDRKMEIPFVFMTGNPDLEMAIDLLTHGGYDYIVKPFMITDFIKKIKSVIKVHKKKKQERKLVKDLKSLLEIRLSELKIYQDVFESTDDGVVITDIEGNIVKINRGFEQITGMSSVQLLHQPLSILQKKILPDLEVPLILNKLREDNTWNGELIGQRNGNNVWYTSISFSPIKDENNGIFAFAGIFKDVTSQRQVEQELIASLRKTNLAQEAIIFGLARLAEHRDNITGFHLERIRNYCKALAEALYQRNLYPDIVNKEFIQMIYRTAPLHDIGKVGIPDSILLKEDKLTEEEFEIIKAHTVIGYQTLNSIFQQYGEMPFLKMGIEVTYAHHEWWDGSGYPRGLKGNKIPLSAQILAIADVYDALTTERTYKIAFSHEESLRLMKARRGKQFNPKLFDVFLEISDQFDQIRRNFPDNKLQKQTPLITETPNRQNTH